MSKNKHLKKTVGFIFILTIIFLAGVYYYYREAVPVRYRYAPEIAAARLCLQDDYSKKVFDSAVKFNSTFDSDTPNFIGEFYEPAHKYVFIHKGDYIIDAGISGDVSQTEYYLIKTGENGMVFGIEPNPNLFEKIEKELSKYNNFVIYKYALWNENGVGEFDLGEEPDDDINASGHIAYIYNKNQIKNSVKVNLIKLDTLVEENNIKKIDYIKFDIEGAELPALNASTKTIKKFLPDLVMSCHHPYDFFKIILFIHSMSPKYRIYMAQHKDGNEYWRNYIVYATVRNSDEKDVNPENPD